MTNDVMIDRKPSGVRSMEAFTCFRWTFRFVTAPRVGTNHAYREIEMRGARRLKRLV